MVDEHAEARRREQLDRQHVDVRQVVLDPRGDLVLQLSLLLECRGSYTTWAPRLERCPSGAAQARRLLVHGSVWRHPDQRVKVAGGRRPGRVSSEIRSG